MFASDISQIMRGPILFLNRGFMLRHERFFISKISLGILGKKIKRVLNRLLPFMIDHCIIKFINSANPLFVLCINFRKTGCHLFFIPFDCHSNTSLV